MFKKTNDSRPSDVSSKLHPIEASELHARRERVYMILAGLFISSMTMLNILGVSRFIDLSFSIGPLFIPMTLPVGVLPYPLTFLCTDFISEIYGKKRANTLVGVGFLVNLWILFVLWFGSVPAKAFGDDSLFLGLRDMAFAGISASMIAYLAAQSIDVHLFHFWKDLTKGKHLWLRNNGSTLVSQFVDSTAVISITYLFLGKSFGISENAPILEQLLGVSKMVLMSYIFKIVCALVDTLPFYWGVGWLSEYLQIDPNVEYAEQNTAIVSLPSFSARKS